MKYLKIGTKYNVESFVESRIKIETLPIHSPPIQVTKKVVRKGERMKM